MKYFKMGEKVIVSAIVEPGYYIQDTGELRREWRRKEIKERKAFYVGEAYKQEGNYTKKPYRHLTNIKVIKVVRIKFREMANDKFALLQDVRRIRE